MNTRHWDENALSDLLALHGILNYSGRLSVATFLAHQSFLNPRSQNIRGTRIPSRWSVGGSLEGWLQADRRESLTNDIGQGGIQNIPSDAKLVRALGKLATTGCGNTSMYTPGSSSDTARPVGRSLRLKHFHSFLLRTDVILDTCSHSVASLFELVYFLQRLQELPPDILSIPLLLPRINLLWEQVNSVVNHSLIMANEN